MRIMFRLAALSAILLIFTSCGASIISVNTANLDYAANPSLNKTAVTSELKIQLSEIIDERASLGDICNSYDADGQIDGKWNSSREVKNFIKEAISSELESEGIVVIADENKLNHPDIPELKGKVRIFYGWLSEKSNYASKVNVDFYITQKSYTIFYKSYLGENTTGSCGASLVQSTRSSMRAAATDIKEILLKEAAYVKK
jgi:hypothetical protein